MRQMYQTLGEAFAIYHVEKAANPFRQYEFIDDESGHIISGDAETAMRLRACLVSRCYPATHGLRNIFSPMRLVFP